MLPIIPATVIGSWSFPGWYVKFCADVAQHPEEYGADDREEALRDAIRLAIVDHEMKQLVQAGVDFVQLDEPSFACHPDHPEEFLDLIARTVAGVNAKISMHMCFGNFRGRAVGWRSYAPLFPHLAKAKVQQLALEFASREMAEIELLKQIPAPMEVAVGLVDVKNTWIEPPELVAQRLH